ncbi:hypothetical protein SH601_04215 [Gracilibacillus sp. S3-1-1]|uniref:Uncharacterized protein n=1 Tax=Gracilibacillus pellucidus TaxID=3095368 RepID=A0ACC6M2T8_9BACI|nr:hypothetical protein [Gracilibacillus sp. S3-1-1]MDX8045185.1 hypothetical protein [Gracilibacillus sp. S3-1-1]
MDQILRRWESIDKDDGEEVDNILFEFHRILTAYEWHFSEISDLNIKVLKFYKDKDE